MKGECSLSCGGSCMVTTLLLRPQYKTTGEAEEYCDIVNVCYDVDVAMIAMHISYYRSERPRI
jgi:hypothetical protein